MVPKSQEAVEPLGDGGRRDGADAAAGGRCERILLAAERLFADRGFENVSIRDIAVEAGSTHPLIYYYWGSKAGLLAAVLERHQTRMRRVARDTDTGARALIGALVRESALGSRQYMLTVARAFMDGMDPSEWPGGYPGVEAALTALLRARADADQAPKVDREVREVLMVVVAMQLGWIMLEEQLLTIVGLDTADRDEARECMLASIQRVLDQVLQTEGSGPERGE